MHSTVHDLSGLCQCQQLPFILAAAQSTEDKCKHIKEVTWGTMLQSQGFFLQGVGSAGTLASQAKNTIAKYKDHAPTKLNYWGCGGNHSWMKAGKMFAHVALSLLLSRLPRRSTKRTRSCRATRI
jgi:hypothetical protein